MTAAARPSRPRWLVTEVVQSSRMDCGPAALKALLEGFGISASYGRLREACQTDLDGTSLNAIEQAAVQLGLDAEQVMVPFDHLLLPEAGALPAIVTLWLPGKLAHFVVAWRRHGPFVQVMDPSSGRRWPSVNHLSRELYAHEMELEAADWQAWAQSEDFGRPFTRRLTDLGLARGEPATLIRSALDQPGWLAVAGLDAATRMVSGLVIAGGLRRGKSAVRVLRALAEEGQQNPAKYAELVPSNYWFARPVAGDAEGHRVRLRGALLVSVRGRSQARTEPGQERDPRPPLSPELAAALSEPLSRPVHDLLRLARAGGAWAPASLFFATLLAAGVVIVEALFLRAFIGVSDQLVLPEQRWMAMAMLGSFLGLLVVLEVPIAAGLLRAGRQLEALLRMSLLHKIPRLGDRYFHSRLTSDMAERSHSVHTVRQLPLLAGRFFQASAEMVFTVAGIAWLDSRSGLVAALSALVIVSIPLVSQPLLAERDFRFRAHTGALTRFVLDGLLGLLPIRAHAAERSVRRQHEALLAEWGRAGLGLHRLQVWLSALQNLAGFGGAAWLLWGHMARIGDGLAPLLLSYWALRLPLLGQELTATARQYPRRRNVMLRLLEPLGAPEDGGGADAPAQPPVPAASGAGGAALALAGVSVKAGGHTILREIDLEVAAGAEVAIVGPSGAGKSTLVGLLLGWHRPATGHVTVDGQPLDGQRLARLRQATAWVDPAVQLWNRSLIDNLTYGLSVDGPPPFMQAIDGAELRGVLERLPDGLRTALGEGGGLVSGGEGQRVRLGRALLRSHTRLVILDEPFRGLDRRLRRELLARARRAWKGATLLCITHDVAETLDFERVLVVEAGRLVEDGDPARLSADPASRYQSLLEAERSLQEELWSDRHWRRLWLEDGRLGTR